MVTNSLVFPTLSEEQQRFASLLKAEFERDGIHLSHVVQLESLFQQNITNSTHYFNVEA